MVTSILDTDIYKFTTSYAYMKLFPEAEGTFVFQDRDNTEYTEEFLNELKSNINRLGSLSLNKAEFDFCTSIRYIPQFYWEWLKGFNFDTNKINISLDDEKHLQIDVTDKLYKVTLYEVPILAIVSETRNRFLNNIPNMDNVIRNLDEKIDMSNTNHLYYSEFGTRRRFSSVVQDAICQRIKERSIYCNGTSNVYYAMKYGMKCIGTHPHEWFMFHGAMYGYKEANYMAMEDWVSVYEADLGIALSDTYTSDVFIKNFSRKHAKLFDGVRHDSGDPYLFVNKVINRYKELGIDPTTKTIILSNALDFPTYLDISNYCKGRIRCAAGIGTNLTNDCGFKPSNIVMKLMRCRMNSRQDWVNCIKISDDKGKHMGDEKEIEICKFQCGID